MTDNMTEKAKAYTQMTPIPTYEPEEPCRLPMFLDKRVYQGSSGRIYPYTITEKISDKKTIKEYNAVYLENEYLLVMLLPELGGRVHRIFDKTNEYDCGYYNETIKPALAGLAGPWVSGGIEFDSPCHHRPTAFERVDFYIEEKDDGSATVHMSETDKISCIKSTASFTLYPGKAYLEVKGKVYNTTGQTKTFLWWAGADVPANETSRTIFPPDVRAVADHGGRSVSKFPVATGTYYNVDYGEGVDISYPKNIPVPTSYMACRSDFDFIGNYDSAAEAGLLHISDHHLSPGKKQWTWGSGDFGRAWYNSLTDENGAYTEISAGVFSSGQPDFAFLAPYEEKTFTQYFMPYKKIGGVKNASSEAAVNLEASDGRADVKIYASSEINAAVTLKGRFNKYISEKVRLSPEDVYECTVETGEEAPENLTLTVEDENGKTIISYTPVKRGFEKLPEPAKAPADPEDIPSLEELWLTAVHLEQNRHASRSPIPYYLEGLKRDPSDIRLNTSYGKLLYNMGLFKESEKYFRAAIEKSTRLNQNPYDCEPYYNLGLALKEQGRLDEAYDAFYKSVWSSAMQDCGYYQLACIASAKGDYEAALEFAESALVKGYHNLKARTLKTALLRHLGQKERAEAFARESIRLDPMSYGAHYELYRLTKDFNDLNTLTSIMQNDLQSYIELSIKYSEAGLFEDAAKVLALISQADRRMLHYYTAYYSNSAVELEIAQGCDSDLYDFPNRLHDIKVLEYVMEHNPSDARAPYDLANLLYARGQWQRAIELWEHSAKLEPDHAETHRNLAFAYFNRFHDDASAVKSMEKAARLAPDDARIFYELDCLYKETNYPMLKRVNAMAENMRLTSSRDDLYTECITIANTLGRYDRALKLINMHTFRPWEGGEGRITAQYRTARIGLGRKAISAGDTEEAVSQLTAALTYPENLGEGKLGVMTDNDIYYYLGCALEATDKILSNEYFEKASQGSGGPEPAVYYSDCPPEMYFYRALAFGKLGDEKRARKMFNRLIDYSEEHMNDRSETDYFAVSLPDFMIFDTDLDRKNKLHCIFMAALGYAGFGKTEKAMRYINAGLELDNSHQGLNILKRSLTGGEENDDKSTEVKRNYVWRK